MQSVLQVVAPHSLSKGRKGSGTMVTKRRSQRVVSAARIAVNQAIQNLIVIRKVVVKRGNGRSGRITRRELRKWMSQLLWRKQRIRSYLLLPVPQIMLHSLMLSGFQRIDMVPV